MKNFVYFFSFCVLASCTWNESVNLRKNKSFQELRCLTCHEGLKFDTVCENSVDVYLSDSLFVSWDTLGQDLVMDNKMKMIFDHRSSLSYFLIEQLLNREISEIKHCTTNEKISKGEIAFVILDKVYRFPYDDSRNPFSDLIFDSYISDCEYPMGFINAVSERRERVNEFFHLYIESDMKKLRECNLN